MDFEPFGTGVTEQVRAAAGALYVTSIDVGALSADKILFPSAAYLVGWSLRESSGAAAAAVELRDGDTTGSTMLASLGIGAGLSSTQHLGVSVLPIRARLLGHVVSGAVVGAVWIGWPGPNPPTVS